nr:hypothetical protein [Tanacetum cinerariifolium]
MCRLTFGLREEQDYPCRGDIENLIDTDHGVVDNLIDTDLRVGNNGSIQESGSSGPPFGYMHLGTCNTSDITSQNKGKMIMTEPEIVVVPDLSPTDYNKTIKANMNARDTDYFDQLLRLHKAYKISGFSCEETGKWEQTLDNPITEPRWWLGGDGEVRLRWFFGDGGGRHWWRSLG